MLKTHHTVIFFLGSWALPKPSLKENTAPLPPKILIFPLPFLCFSRKKLFQASLSFEPPGIIFFTSLHVSFPQPDGLFPVSSHVVCSSSSICPKHFVYLRDTFRSSKSLSFRNQHQKKLCLCFSSFNIPPSEQSSLTTYEFKNQYFLDKGRKFADQFYPIVYVLIFHFVGTDHLQFLNIW